MFSANPGTRRRDGAEPLSRGPMGSLLGAAVLLLLLAACTGAIAGPAESQSEGLVDDGSWYVRVQWPHDGLPYESERFVVYSDAASLEARIEVADRAERLWTEIVSEMGIDGEVLALPPGQEKTHIYAFKDYAPDWAGKAYYGGLVISSPDRRTLFGLAGTKREQHESTLKHELIHVMTLSLLNGGGLPEPPWVHVWFFEGFAEALSAGTTGGSIQGMDHFDHLTSKYGHLNPVSYRSDEAVTGGVKAYTEYHYPMRQLAVEYLFDEDGLGRTPRDATGLFTDMAAGSEFASAFADHMGISLHDYENQFFGLMGGYLPDRSVSAAFGPIGLLIISVLSVGLALVFVIRGIRSSPAMAPAQAVTTGAFSRRLSRIAFGVWIAAFSAFAVGLFLIGMYSVGGSWALTEAKKAAGIAVMTSFLGVSAAVLTWAMRSRRTLSRHAWLIPCAVIGAGAAMAPALIVAVL